MQLKTTEGGNKSLNVKRSSQSLNILGPTRDEVTKRKRLRAEEYRRDLIAQMEEQRQRKEQEKAARLGQERMLAQEQDFKQKLSQDTLWKMQGMLYTKRIEDTNTSTGVSQKHRYTFLDPAENESIQRKHLREEEYKRDLNTQIEEQRQQKKHEKALWLAEQRAEEHTLERRLKREQGFKQCKSSHDTLSKRQEDAVKPEEPHAAMGTTQNSRYAHNLSGFQDPAQLELLQRKRVRDEEYRRELDMQMEEQRQGREKEKADRLAQELSEERAEVHWLNREKEFKRQSPQQDALCKRQQHSVKKEMSHTNIVVTRNHRYSLALLDPAEIESIQRKNLKEEEYKSGLDAQVEEQRQQKEQEKAAQRAEERAEEQSEQRRQKREQAFKQWKFPYDTLGKRQEDAVKPEELRAAMGTPQNIRYAHNLSCLMDPAQLELLQRKRVRDEEYRRELDMQMEEQRQRREKEKADRLAQELSEERAEVHRLNREKEFKRQNPQQDVLCKRQQHSVKKESCTSIVATQNYRYPQNQNSPLDPPQIDTPPKTHHRDEEYRDLNVPMEPQRQRREKDKLVRLPEEQADEWKQSQELKQPKFQQDTIAKREDRNLKEGTQCNILGQRMPVVARRSSDISRQLHSTDREYISFKGNKSWDVIGFAVGSLARLEATGPSEMAVRIVRTKDSAVQTDQNDGVMPTLKMVVPTVPRPMVCHVDNRPPSPPVPVVQRRLQQQSAGSDPPPSEGTTEADQTNLPAAPSGFSPRSGDPVLKTPSPTPVRDPFLHDDQTKQVVLSGLSQLLQVLQAKHRELEMAV